MTWCGHAVILFKATQVLAGLKAPLLGRQRSTGYELLLFRLTFTFDIVIKVHPDNLVPLKLAILRNLPVLGM